MAQLTGLNYQAKVLPHDPTRLGGLLGCCVYRCLRGVQVCLVASDRGLRVRFDR